MATGYMGKKSHMLALWWAGVKLIDKKLMVLNFDQMHIILSPYSFLKTECPSLRDSCNTTEKMENLKIQIKWPRGTAYMLNEAM